MEDSLGFTIDKDVVNCTLLSKLKEWGYTHDWEAPEPLDFVVQNLQTSTLFLVQKLASHLSRYLHSPKYIDDGGQETDGLKKQDTRLSQEPEKQVEEVEKLTDSNECLLSEAGSLCPGIEKQISKESGVLRSELEKRAKEIENLTAWSEQLSEDNNRLRSELEKRGKEVEELTAWNGRVAEENSRLRSELEQKILEIEGLTERNRVLVEENERLRSEVENLREGKAELQNEEEEERLQQWRAQSMHQILELERMNEALRSTLKLHSDCTGSQGACDSHCGGHILLSEALELPITTTLCPNQKSHVEHRNKLDLIRISEKQYKSMEEELQDLKEQQASMHNTLKVTQAELAAKDKEIKRVLKLSRSLYKCEIEGKSAGLTELASNLGRDHLNSGKAMIEKVEDLENKVKEFQNTIKGQESTIESLQKELTQKSEQLTFITDEKAVGEEALEASQNECNQLASLIKELDERMTQLTTALTTRTIERDSAMLVEKQEADARMLVEDDLRKKRDDLICQLGLARNEQTRLQIELEKCRKEQQEDRLKLAEAHSDLEQNQKHLGMAEKDIEQLKSLITQLDATREELVGKIKSIMADQQLAENHVTELEAEVQRLVEEVEIRNAEISQLHSLVESLSTEGGHLRSEIEFQAQKLSEINEENDRLVSETSSLQRNLQLAEEKLQNAVTENASLKDHFSMLEKNKMVVEDRCAAKSGELQVVAEDFRNAMCELQLLKNELLQMAGERENLFENLKKMNARLQYFEQLVCVKDKDEKEFSVAYEKLSEEHQQLKLAAIGMDAQVQQYRFQLQNMEEVLQRTQATAKSLDEESRKAKSEWKNLGRQVDVMSHSLAQQSSVIDDLHKEKSALLAQLSMSKQKMLDMEQKHTNVVREAAAIESKNQILTSLVQEKMQEAETLVTRFRMEHERVKELEQLLACMRAQEHQLALESKDSEAKAAMMKEKLLALEEEVRTLHATKDAQKDELLHLQAMLREKNEYGNRRHLAVSTNKENQFHPVAMDSTGSKAKVHELELRTIALAADLSKTAALYKDCLARLQKAEAQCIEQKKEYEYVLSILSKVDDDRILLQQKCRVLVGGTERVDHLKSMKYSDRMVENPEVEVLEVKLQICDMYQANFYIRKISQLLVFL